MVSINPFMAIAFPQGEKLPSLSEAKNRTWARGGTNEKGCFVLFSNLFFVALCMIVVLYKIYL